MPKISVAVPYNVTLDPVEVKEESGPMLQEQLQELQVRNFQIEWTDMAAEFRFTSYGFLVQGTVDVQPKQIVVHVKLPWVAAMFKERIRKGIAEGIAEALNAPTP
jgi:hypothetical protein